MIRGVKRVCLGCGTLTPYGSRCEPCQAAKDREIEARRGTRPHYAGDYRKRAKIVRESALVCACCGKAPTPEDPMQADHVREGDPGSPLQPLLRSCNIRKSKNKSTKSDR